MNLKTEGSYSSIQFLQQNCAECGEDTKTESTQTFLTQAHSIVVNMLQLITSYNLTEEK